MTVITHRTQTTRTTHSVSRHVPNPVHATLLAGSVPLFLGAMLSDIAYFKTYEIQWSNFSAWLIAGGLVFCGLALLFALANLIGARHKQGRPLIYFALLLATWVLGFSTHWNTPGCLGDHAPRAGALGDRHPAGLRGQLDRPEQPALGR